MKLNIKYFYRFIIVVVLSAPLALQAALPEFTEIVEHAKDSVVNISTKTRPQKSNSSNRPSIPDLPEDSPLGELFEKFFNHENPGGRRPDAQSLGSGFIISEDGYILTNHHVITDADEVIVRLANREEYVATVIGSDEASDVAVLKVSVRQAITEGE